MTKTVLPTSLSFLALSIMAASPAFSADSLIQDTQLNTIMIEASYVAAPTSKAGSLVSQVDSDTLAATLTRNLDDLVRYEPGVEASRDSRSSISSINIRGLEGDRIKISIDGVPQADSYAPPASRGQIAYLGAGRNTLDTDSLESVTIIKGGDIVEGSGGLGGVVKYQTKEPSRFLAPQVNDTGASLKMGYKSASDEFHQTITAANRTGKVESLLLYTHRDGHENKNHKGDAGEDRSFGATRGSVDPFNTGSDNLLAKVQAQLNDHNRVGVVGEYFHSNTKATLYSESMATEQRGLDDQSIRRRMGFFHENTQANTLYDRLMWQWDYQNTKTTNKTHISTNNRLVDRFYDEDSISVRADLIKQINAHHIRYGANYDVKSLENLNKNRASGSSTVSRFAPLADADIFGLYLEDHWFVTDNLTLIPAIRYDNYQYTTKGDEYIDSWGDNKNEAITAQLAAHFAINDTYTLFGKAGSGFRAPNLNELYYYFENSVGGNGYRIKPNPNLKPEESLFVEAGVRAENRLGAAELVAFYNDYRRFIEQVSLGSSAAYRRGEFTNSNIDQVVIKGIEFKGSLDLSKSIEALSEGWTLNGAIAYAEGDNLEDNEPLDSISPMSAVVGLGYDAPSEQWGGKLNLTWAASKKAEDITNSKQWLATSDYQLVDLTAYYKPSENLQFNVGLFNLTDEKYSNWNDVRNIAVNNTNLDRYTRAGRNFGIDATLSF